MVVGKLKGLHTVETDLADVTNDTGAVQRDERNVVDLDILGDVMTVSVLVRQVDDVPDKGFCFRDQHRVNRKPKSVLVVRTLSNHCPCSLFERGLTLAIGRFGPPEGNS